MSKKNIITAILLLFVSVSIGYMVAGDKKEKNNPLPETKNVKNEDAPSEKDSPDPRQDEKTRFVAYYFYNNKRCASCRKIEMFTDASINDEFTKELESGKLEWKPVNVDEPENKHYIDDFDLYTKQVILAEFRGDQMTRWKNLKEVWNLLNDEYAFREYIIKQSRDFIEGKPDNE